MSINRIAQMHQNNRRTLYFDILNIISCISVIFLHHNGLVHKYTANLRGPWSQALLVEVFCFFAVPIFLMISGSTLMDYRKRYDTRTFFKKRLTRVLTPFIIWSVITFFIAILKGKYVIESLSFSKVWNIFMTSDMMSIYWFFPVIISIYFAMPILSLLTEQTNRKWLWYMFFMGFITYSILPPLCKLSGIYFNDSYTFPLTAGFIIFPILGYLLSTEKIKRKWLITLTFVSIGSLALRYAVTYFLTLQDGSTNYLLGSYLYFTGLLPAATIFLLAKQINWNKYIKGRNINIISAISSCSLGIYLVHVIVMDLEIKVLNMKETQFLWRTLMPIVTYLMCLIIVWLFKKFTITRHLFP